MSLNEGNYRVSFEPVDPYMTTPDLSLKPKKEAVPRFYRVPPCVLNKTECTLGARKKAKAENP